MVKREKWSREGSNSRPLECHAVHGEPQRTRPCASVQEFEGSTPAREIVADSRASCDRPRTAPGRHRKSPNPVTYASRAQRTGVRDRASRALLNGRSRAGTGRHSVGSGGAAPRPHHKMSKRSQLPPDLRRVWRTTLGHRELLFPRKGSGVHETGSTPHAPTV